MLWRHIPLRVARLLVTASYVVDTNFLREPELVSFLAASNSNSVAIAEYTCTESYQGDALVNIVQSMHHLCSFPRQVVVLRWAIGLVADEDRLDRPLVRADLIEPDQTEHFPQFCDGIRAADLGNVAYRSQISEHGAAATKQLTVLRDGAALVGQGIRAIAAVTDKDRLKRIRKRASFTKGDIDWFLGYVFQMARELYDSHPKIPLQTESVDVMGHWILRYALAGCVLMKRWIRDGGIESIPPRKLGNDVIDMTIATYGTYFDGVLSRDEKLLELHDEMRWILEHVFRVPVGW